MIFQIDDIKVQNLDPNEFDSETKKFNKEKFE